MTFLYTGPVIQAGGIDTPFDGFQIISSVGAPDASGTFSSQSTLNVGPSSGETDQVFGPVATPAPGLVSAQDTPEPSTLFLMGAGLLCIGLFRRSTRYVDGMDRGGPGADGHVGKPAVEPAPSLVRSPSPRRPRSLRPKAGAEAWEEEVVRGAASSSRFAAL